MTALTATVAAASVVLPLVIQGEQLGKLHDGGCSGREVRSVLGTLRDAGRGPTRTEPIVIDTGDLLAPDPNTRYAVTGGGPGLSALARALGGIQPVFDVVVPGRYDLALRRDRLALLTERAALPWTVANLTPRFASKPFRIILRDGVRVGLTAVIDERMGASMHPRVRAEKLLEARQALSDAVKALRKEGADVVIAISQQPEGEALQTILRLVDGSEVLPDVLVMSPVTGDVAQIDLGPDRPIVLAAPSGYRRVLVAHLEVRRGGRAVRFLGARQERLEPERNQALDEVRREVCEALGRPIGPNEDAPSKITRERFVGFVLELIRRRTGAEVAVISRETVRDAFPVQGPLTPLDLLRLIPFDDGLQVASVAGSRMSGLFRLASDPRAMVSGLEPGRVAGRDLDAGRTYSVAAVDFLAAGGDAVFSPDELPWVPREDLGELRDLIAEYLEEHGFDADADPDDDDNVSEPALFSAQLNLSGNLKTVTTSNEAEYEAPQLSRNDFLGITTLLDLRIIADFARHRLQLFERTRFGIAREGTEDAQENDDVTTIELTYIGRFASNKEPWYVPNASAAISLETELTLPTAEESDREYRRALLQAGIGPSFPLLPNVSLRVQFGLRRELEASPNSEDEQERLLAETRIATLSTLEILKYTIPTNYERPLTTTLRVDHTFDLTGSVRDNILQGRLDFDIPVARRLSVTFGLELYFQDRSLDEGDDPRSGLAFDTSFGIKTFGDISTALF